MPDVKFPGDLEYDDHCSWLVLGSKNVHLGTLFSLATLGTRVSIELDSISHDESQFHIVRLNDK